MQTTRPDKANDLPRADHRSALTQQPPGGVWSERPLRALRSAPPPELGQMLSGRVTRGSAERLRSRGGAIEPGEGTDAVLVGKR